VRKFVREDQLFSVGVVEAVYYGSGCAFPNSRQCRFAGVADPF
jgi:hypothetical protein